MSNQKQVPASNVVQIIEWIYHGEMTTSTGGNISMRAPNGNIWITPSRIDKGMLTPEDIVCLNPNGDVKKGDKPSSELPSHLAIYDAKPDIGAVVHAHPQALITFSMTGQVPNTNIIPRIHEICGDVGFAPSRLPGSQALGNVIAQEFAEGYQAVVMENHGVVVGGRDLDEAFHRFELLEWCAQMIINAKKVLNSESEKKELKEQNQDSSTILEFTQQSETNSTQNVCNKMCQLVNRLCRRKLMASCGGSLSVQYGKGNFLVTPENVNKRCLQPGDIVWVEEGRHEKGKVPDRTVRLHQQLYERHPEVKCVIITRPPHIMALGLANQTLDTHTLPESYVFLRNIPLVTYPDGLTIRDITQKLTQIISVETPIILIQNEALVVTGRTIQEAFDRLEITESSACSSINTAFLGKPQPLDTARLKGLEQFIS